MRLLQFRLLQGPAPAARVGLSRPTTSGLHPGAELARYGRLLASRSFSRASASRANLLRRELPDERIAGRGALAQIARPTVMLPATAAFGRIKESMASRFPAGRPPRARRLGHTSICLILFLKDGETTRRPCRRCRPGRPGGGIYDQKVRDGTFTPLGHIMEKKPVAADGLPEAVPRPTASVIQKKYVPATLDCEPAIMIEINGHLRRGCTRISLGINRALQESIMKLAGASRWRVLGLALRVKSAAAAKAGFRVEMWLSTAASAAPGRNWPRWRNDTA